MAAGWPPGFDPFLGAGGGGGDPLFDPYGPYSLGLLGPGGPPAGAGGWFDPFWTPGAQAASRRRLNGPPGERAGAPGAEAGGGAGTEDTPHPRMREPYTVGSAGWTRSIPCDFIEREKEYIVRADMPGAKKAEIHVEVHDGTVLRFGHNPGSEREKEDLEEEGIFHRSERVTTFRNRNLRMPDDADMSAEIKASYEDGVLSVVIPKKSERRPESKAIEVA